MGVIRVEHNENYTTMANYHLRDSRLSLRAMGLMSKMLSLPDDWDYSVAGLTKIVKEGREAVRKALQELESAGYLIREQSRQGGNFAGYDYTLFEQPQAGAGSPSPKKPSTGNPSTEIPSTGNPPQINNEKNQKTKQQKHAPAVPEWEPEMFERFWRAYPRHEDRKTAAAEWDKLRPDLKLMRAMSSALDRAKTTDEWRRGVGIPYACRWLSKQRWLDEPNDLIAAEEPAPAAIEEGPEWI
jgi:hypothetical protein